MLAAPNHPTRPTETLAIPGLTESAPYFSRLSARSALYTEFHQLLSIQGEVLESAAYRKLVVDDNCLSKTSMSARVKHWQELKSRYRLGASDPLFVAFFKEWERCRSEPERSLTAYVLWALNDRLVADLGTEWLFPLLRRAPAEVRLADVTAFIERSFRKHPEAKVWSSETRLAVAQKYLSSIRDFGLAQGTVRKTSIRPALYGPPIRFLIRALRLGGIAPLGIVQAPAFKLLCLDTTEVIEALGELNGTGALRFRMQADIVEIDVEGPH